MMIMVKDPNRPNGRTSAYAFFVLSCRDELRKRSPTSPVNFTTFSKDCSEQWTAMSPSEKKKFEDMAKADQARYEEEMKHYVPPKDVGKKGKKKDPRTAKRPPFSVFSSELRPTVKIMVKDPNRPNGRTSAYAFFVLSCRDELRKRSPTSPVNFSTFSKDCSEQWTAMSPSEKKKFEDMAKADQARYEEEMKHYVPPKDVGKKEPPKKPTSAFFIFCSELRPTLRSEYPNFSLSEIAKKLVEMWSKLDTEGRAPFEQKAVLLRGKYEKDVATCRAGGGAPKRGPGGPAGSTKKAQAGPEGEEDEDEEDDCDDDDMEDEEDEDEEEDEVDDDMEDEDEAEEDEDSDDLVDEEEEEEDKERT
ncbi:high mobility group protein B2-like isoform X1 [Pygocentrus nattereri]|nr:high mobility group protein B2-like isoform X1 [Pygocentrus nattereri]